MHNFLLINQCVRNLHSLGSHVELELKKFAERRTDIFGTGAQETIIGRKVCIGYISQSNIDRYQC
jgi:hypothetical protein